MIQFLFKGILRDKNRSMLPIIVVSFGVFLTVLMSCLITGVMGDMVDLYARFTTGHVKIMTKAYQENSDQNPNDLALMDTDQLISDLKNTYPDMEWVERIHFGGLMDVADENGDTREQGPAVGMAIDLLSPDSKEVERLSIEKSLRKGALPKKSGEALISDEFAAKLQIEPGDDITLFGSTMYGGMAFQNFKISGTVSFGTTALDRGAIIVDLKDAQQTLDMENAAGEVLGYLSGGRYKDKEATAISDAFNAKYADDNDEYAPVMVRLQEQDQLREIMAYSGSMTSILVFIFLLAMSVVIWNTGLLGGLRRYREFGVRLALGESKGQIFRSLILESVLIGIVGSIIGTIMGLGVAYYMQEVGWDISEMLQQSNISMMLPSTYRAEITSTAFFVGFIPGLFAMVLGNGLAGRGIYKRETARLFKELEV